MDKKIIVILSIITSLSIVNLLYLFYLQFSVNNLDKDFSEKLSSLDSRLINLYSFSKAQTGTIDDRKFKSVDPFDNKDFFDMQDRINQQMKEFMSESMGENKFHVNIVPNTGNYMSFSNKYTVNGKQFQYLINISGNIIHGEIISDDLDKLSDLNDKLKKFDLKISLDGNILKFEGENIDYSDLLKLFDINSSFQVDQPTDKQPQAF